MKDWIGDSADIFALKKDPQVEFIIDVQKKQKDYLMSDQTVCMKIPDSFLESPNFLGKE